MLHLYRGEQLPDGQMAAGEQWVMELNCLLSKKHTNKENKINKTQKLVWKKKYKRMPQRYRDLKMFSV